MKVSEPYDVFVIGGGINGCGVARDAVGRGLSVCLAEKGDLAGATSSGSTKLIHGGLRYLEHFEFNLVRKALQEREVLWRIAPHIIYPLRFVLPHHQELRPAWLLRLGLFIYDHLGGRKLLPGTRVVSLEEEEVGEPLRSTYKKGFEYSDCWVDDARLVVLNALDAANRGARILTRTEVVSAWREKDLWSVHTRNQQGLTQRYTARVLVNAAGPWVERVLTQVAGEDSETGIRMVRGSHIVVPRIFEHDKCYIFQNSDKRIVFAIPYESEFTLIGTTDRDHTGDPGDAQISDEEVAYLCDSANSYFAQNINPVDIVWTYSAVRPLYDDGTKEARETTRDYNLRVEDEDGCSPLITIYGGKITTYRKLAEAVMEKLSPYLSNCGPQWTDSAQLPGGDFPVSGFSSLVSILQSKYPFLNTLHVERLVRTYGTLAQRVIGNPQRPEDLGRCFGSNLFEVEVQYLIEREWAASAEDILWRRTKEGLRLSSGEAGALDRYIIDSLELERPSVALEQ